MTDRPTHRPRPTPPLSPLWWLLSATVLVVVCLVSLLPLRPPRVVAATAPASEFSAERAGEVVAAIAQSPHPVGSPEARRVADLLEQRLAALGLETRRQRATVAENVWGDRVRAVAVDNVLARLPGNGSGNAVLLVAHYDTVPHSPGASDDSSGVAAVLEAVRALATEPHRNDVMVLLTDSEELGLSGARAFVDDPWAQDVAAVLNFEARGTRGPSLMFETTGSSPELMRRFATAARHPVAFSFSYDVYRLLPNDTDFSVLRRLARAGFNFAFIGGADRYHSSGDRLAALDPRSLQHHGDYALGLGRELANADLSALPTPSSSLYFPLPGLGLMVYPTLWDKALLVLAEILLIVAMVRAKLAGRLSVKAILVALAPLPAALVAAVALAFLLAQAGTLAFGLEPAALSEGRLVLAGWTVLALSCVIAASLLVRRCGALAVGFATAVWAGVLTTLTVIALPATSYLFVWPNLLLCIVLVVVAARADGAAPGPAALLVPMAGAALLWTPVLVLLAAALGATAGTVLAALTVVAALTLPPLIVRLTDEAPRWWAAGAVATAGLVFVVVGFAASGYGADNPRPDSLFYALSPAAGEALWLSFDDRPDGWTHHALGDAPDRRTVAAYFEDPEELLAASAPLLSLPAPEIEWIGGDGARTELRLVSRRDASRLDVTLRSTAAIRAVTIDGQHVELESGKTTQGEGGEHRVLLRLAGHPEDGFAVGVDADREAPLSVAVNDRVYGLPAELTGADGLPPRPADLRPSRLAFSDLSLVHAEATFAAESAADESEDTPPEE